jgi:AraC-like DNA-binding protein
MSVNGKYFIISKEDMAWGLYVPDCGFSIIQPGAAFSSVDHPQRYQLDWNAGRILHEYQIFYLYKGKGVFESTQSGSIRLLPGSLVLVYPGVRHRYRPIAPGEWYTYWAGFNGNFADQLVNNLPMTKSNPVLNIGYQDKLAKIFLDILETSQQEFTGYQQVLAGDLFRLFGWLRSLHRQKEFGNYDAHKIIQGAKTIMIRDNLNIQAEQIARDLNMGYSKFRKLFKEYTGLAPGQYLLQLRIKRAEQLLNEDKLSIKEISAHLGFESPQYFSRIFKKKTGNTPGNIKKKSVNLP